MMILRPSRRVSLLACCVCNSISFQPQPEDPPEHGLFTLLADYPWINASRLSCDKWGSGDLEPAIAPEPLPFLVALVRDAVGRAVVADAELRHGHGGSNRGGRIPPTTCGDRGSNIKSRTRASVSNAARRWISCRSRGRSLSYCSFRRIRRSPPGRALASLPWRPARETEAHDHMGRTQASWTQWRQGCLVRLRERRGGTHRHGNRVSMSCARCRQSNTLFPEATSCIPRLSTPYPVIPRYDSYCG